MIKIYEIVTIVYALLITVYVFRKREKLMSAGGIQIVQEERTKQITKWIPWVLIALGALIRLYQFGEFPYLNQDSAMAAVDAKALWRQGTDRFGTRYPVHFYAWGYGQMSTLMSYMMIPFFALIGYSEVAVRMPIFLLSICGMVAMYMIGKDLWGEKGAVTASVVCVMNPWHFCQSRWALDANMFPHVVIIAIAFLIHFIEKEKKRYLYISMIFWGLSHFCYGISLYTVPVILLSCCVYFCVKKLANAKDVLIACVIYLGIAWPFLLCMMINTFKWQTIHTPVFTIQRFSESVRSRDILFFSHNVFGDAVSNLQSVYRLTVLQKIDNLWDGVDKVGQTGRFMSIFVIPGIYMIFKEIKQGGKKRCRWIVLLIYTGVALASGVITKEVNTNRINIFWYAYMLLIVAGIQMLWQVDRRAFITTVALYAGMFVLMVCSYFTSYKRSFQQPPSVNYDFNMSLKETKELRFEKIYITPDVMGGRSIILAEIDTLHVHDVDIPYYWGQTNINHGQEVLPYQERYQYIRASELDVIDSAENAVYIINWDDRELFDEELFDKDRHGQFAVVTVKERVE